MIAIQIGLIVSSCVWLVMTVASLERGSDQERNGILIAIWILLLAVAIGQVA